MKALQVVQNKAARCVTKLSWFTPTRQLLCQCGWLSIKQLAFYHTVLTVHRIMKSGKPVFLRSKLTTEYQYQTRQATGGHLRLLTMVEGSFICRAVKDFNSIPDELKIVTSIPTFKKKLKKWTSLNIPIE